MIQRGNCLSGKSKILMSLFENDLNNGKVYHDELFRRAYYSGIEISDIEDLIQDFYISMSKNIKNFRGEINEFTDLSKDNALGPYLFVSFKNKSIDFLRQKKRDRLRFSSCSEGRKFDFFDIENRQGPNEPPYKICSKNEREKRIKKALNYMNPKQRTILIQRHFNHCSYKEIAESQEIPMGTVKSRLNASRKRLRRLEKIVKITEILSSFLENRFSKRDYRIFLDHEAGYTLKEIGSNLNLSVVGVWKIYKKVSKELEQEIRENYKNLLTTLLK